MIRNYLTGAIRNLARHKGYLSINMTGLSLGIASSLLIVFHVQDELSYDRHLPKADRVYRLTQEMMREGRMWHWAVVSTQHGPHLLAELPEVERFTQLYTNESVNLVLSHTRENGQRVRFEETGAVFADQGAVSIFDLAFVAGDSGSALVEANTVVLTERTARRYFGDVSPVGKTLTVSADSTDLKVTGVVKALPRNSHLQFDLLVSMPTFRSFMVENGLEDLLQSRGWAGVYTYVLLRPETSREAVEAKFPDFLTRFYGDMGTRQEILSIVDLHLQPVTDIHLRSHLEQEMSPNGSIAYVYAFTATAFFILVIAAVNFINITTTLAIKRMKEVRVRKLLGAHRRQLLTQFLGEFLLVTGVAALIALGLFEISFPFYSEVAGKTLQLRESFTGGHVATFCSIVIGTWLLAGLYPAMFMSRMAVRDSLQGSGDANATTFRLRNVLVVGQFAVSVVMIFSSLIAVRQMQFIRGKDLGFDKSQIAVLKLNGSLQGLAVRSPDVIRSALMAVPSVEGVTAVSNPPGDRFSVEALILPGQSSEPPPIRFVRADQDYVQTLGLEVIAGSVPEGGPGTGVSALIINEAALKVLGIDDPVGARGRTMLGAEGEIKAVVKDYHFASLHDAIEPLVIEHNADEAFRRLTTSYLLVRIQGGDPGETLSAIQEKLEEMSDDYLFTHTFLDDSLNRLYDAERRMSEIFRVFTMLGIFISCIGLFGVSSYTAELRTKEVGIRKAMGATAWTITIQMTRDLVLWTVLASAISLPIGWYLMDGWLRNFAYRVEIDAISVVASVTMAVFVALVAVGYQAIRSAHMNPVDALRYE